jgi:hypothetical protein
VELFAGFPGQPAAEDAQQDVNRHQNDDNPFGGIGRQAQQAAALVDQIKLHL